MMPSKFAVGPDMEIPHPGVGSARNVGTSAESRELLWATNCLCGSCCGNSVGTAIRIERYTSTSTDWRTPTMSDPRNSDPGNFEGETKPMRDRVDGRVDGRESENGGAGWIIALVIAAIVLGAAAYTYRGEQTASSSNTPETTSGQSTRAPVPSTPPSTPVAPAPAKPTPPDNPSAPENPPQRAQ